MTDLTGVKSGLGRRLFAGLVILVNNSQRRASVVLKRVFEVAWVEHCLKVDDCLEKVFYCTTVSLLLSMF